MERNRPRPPAEPTVAAEAGNALSLDQVESVLRRAVQIDARARVPDGPGLSPEDLTRIALEAGLSPDAIDSAMRELQLGALAGEQKLALLDRLFGPATASAGRVVDLPPAAAEARLQRLLRAELLEPAERSGRRTLWAPARGLRAGVLRALRVAWHGEGNWKSMEITTEVRAANAAGTRSIVSVEARLANRVGTTVAPVVGTALSSAAVGAIGLEILAQGGHLTGALVLAPVLATLAGAAVTGAVGAGVRRGWTQRLRRARISLDRLLDRPDEPEL